VKQLQDMTGWRGEQVLYFGDHPYSDLADVTLEHGWRTGAIIHELKVSCNTRYIVFSSFFSRAYLTEMAEKRVLGDLHIVKFSEKKLTNLMRQFYISVK